MNQFIQTLESRQMFSAAPIVPHLSVGTLPPVPHVTMNLTAPMYFQGTALHGDGSLDADLLITMKASGKGYSATVLICNPNGKITPANLMLNAAGQFTYTDNEGGNITTVIGQLSANKQTITASITHTNPNGSSTGTISCSRTTTAPTETNYSGTMKSGAQSAGLTATLVKTSTGYLGVFNMVAANPSSSNNGLFFTVNSTGAFTATSVADPGLTVTGQLSSNGKILAGTFSGLAINNGTTTLNGTFSLART